jgi:hypothetical protein
VHVRGTGGARAEGQSIKQSKVVGIQIVGAGDGRAQACGKRRKRNDMRPPQPTMSVSSIHDRSRIMTRAASCAARLNLP